jgi:hypothetical protein
MDKESTTTCEPRDPDVFPTDEADDMQTTKDTADDDDAEGAEAKQAKQGGARPKSDAAKRPLITLNVTINVGPTPPADWVTSPNLENIHVPTISEKP